jgi:hypothetical protein
MPVYSDAAKNAREASSPEVVLGDGIDAPGTILFTQLLDEEKLKLIQSIKWAPVLFQEHIRKECDVRVSVIGTRIVSCRMESQAHTDNIEASFKKGVLTITLPKKPEAIKTEKKIEVKVPDDTT